MEAVWGEFGSLMSEQKVWNSHLISERTRNTGLSGSTGSPGGWWPHILSETSQGSMNFCSSAQLLQRGWGWKASLIIAKGRERRKEGINTKMKITECVYSCATITLLQMQWEFRVKNENSGPLGWWVREDYAYIYLA